MSLLFQQSTNDFSVRQFQYNFEQQWPRFDIFQELYSFHVI